MDTIVKPIKSPELVPKCHLCASQDDLDLVIYCMEQNSNPGYLVFKENKVIWGKVPPEKFASAIGSSEICGVIPLCTSCVQKVRVEIGPYLS